MIPLSDHNPRTQVPVLTYIIIVINVVVFLTQLGMTERQLIFTFIDQAVVPARISADPFSAEALLDSLRSMFFHGGWLHLISNMLYLWIFGDNVEDRLGKLLYLVLYFGSGFAAILAQIAIDPASEIPLVGASGAIAGVLGSYALMFPRASVRGLVFLGFFAQFVELPALLVLGFWFVTQLFSGVASLGVQTGAGGGVAFFAHIGGFVFGLALTWLLRGILRPPTRQTYTYDWRRN